MRTTAMYLRGLALTCAAILTTSAFTQDKPVIDKPSGPPAAPELKLGTTLDNLLTAYQGERLAYAKYAAFATKADEEGYAGVASLLRAAARAEQVHAKNHQAVIEKMGGQPLFEETKFEVKSTRENLEAALAGENYERLTMYPEFITRARSDTNADALRTFNYAKTAEAEHAVLFKKALAELDAWKSGKRDFFVCSVCGFTTSSIDFEKCPSCFTLKERYEKVN